MGSRTVHSLLPPLDDLTRSDSEVDFTLTLTSSLLVSPAPIDANAFFHLLRTKATETKTGRLAGSLSAVISAITGAILHSLYYRMHLFRNRR